MSPRFGMRFGAALLSLALVGVASAASAHVTVSSPDARPGESAKLVFQVPTESATASTTAVTVNLPANIPFAFVSTQTKRGWTAKLTEQKHATPVKIGDFTVSKTVSAVTWTATGTGIEAGQFDEFSVSVGPIAKVKSLQFTVVQTYSDKSVINWDQIQTGKVEPEHPAPTLVLTSAPSPVRNTTIDHATSDHTARGLAIAALAIAAVSGLVGLRNNRRHA